MSDRALSRAIVNLSALCLFFTIVPVAAAHDGPEHRATAPSDDGDPAVRSLTRRVTENPLDAKAWARLGSLRLQRARHSSTHEEYHAAADAFRTLLELEPGSADARVGLAYALIGLHGFEEALRLARQAAEFHHDEPRTWAVLGDAHFALGHYAEAELCYARLAAAGMTVESLSRTGQIHSVRGRINEAAQAFDDAYEAGKLLDAPPATLAWCRTMLGELYREQGQADRARTAYRQALEYEPSDAVATWRLAEFEAAAGRRDEAIGLLRPVAQSADRPAIWIAFGDMLAAAGQDHAARSWFARAEADMTTDLAAGDVGHLRELAEYWLSHEGDVSRAVELALKDLREVRQDAGAFETAAWALHRAGRHREAIALMTTAFRSGPGTERSRERAAAIRAALRPAVAVMRAEQR